MADCIMPDAFMERTPRARKPHRCDECCAVIPAGSVYWKGSGIWDGEPDTWKAHLACAKFRDRLNHHLQHDVGYHADECVPFGCLTDYVDAYDREEIDGWRSRWLRLRDWMRRRYGVPS